jgi:alkylation response protein AidB-like acyl-CoA dehydrogenase
MANVQADREQRGSRGVALNALETVGGGRSSPAVLPGSAELRTLIAQIDEHVLDREREARPPFAEYDLVRHARLGALRVPVELGGAGCSLRELLEVVLELSKADPNLAHSLRNHFVFVESRIRSAKDGTADGWLEKAVEGRIFGSAATEPGSEKAGRRNQRFATTVTGTGRILVLNGTKFYSTGNLYADLIVVSAETEDHQKVRVVVPAHREGVIHEDDWDGIGQRLTGSGTTRFEDVQVGPEEFLSDGAIFSDDVPYQATLAQLWLTTVIAGILQRVARDAAGLVLGRERTFYHAPTDRPVDDPILQQTVGYIASNAYAAETLVLAAADALDRSTASVLAGRPDHELSLQAALRAAKAKVVIDELALRTASIVFEVGGATAARQSTQLDRHWRNIRTLASHNPSTYKAMWIGGYEISGSPLPTGAFF